MSVSSLQPVTVTFVSACYKPKIDKQIGWLVLKVTEEEPRYFKMYVHL